MTERKPTKEEIGKILAILGVALADAKYIEGHFAVNLGTWDSLIKQLWEYIRSRP